MDEWITQTINSLGYFGVAALMFLENVFPPLPSELIMPAAGYAAARGAAGGKGGGGADGGGLTLVGVIVAGSLGSLLGQAPLYVAGRLLGRERVRTLADRYGRWITVTGEDIDKASAWFGRRGGVSVALCRLVPGVRSLISLPAGMEKMHPVPFALYSGAGIVVWTAVLGVAGYALGSQYERVEKFMGPASWVVVGLIACAFVGRFVLRYRRCFGKRGGGGNASGAERGCRGERTDESAGERASVPRGAL